MPRIMTMNGDHQSVAAAPLDLRTTTRDRGSAAPRSPGCTGGVRGAQATGGSPAPPACTGTDSMRPHSPGVRGASVLENGAARKRAADKSSLRLPLRKRPIYVDQDTESQTPAPADRGDRALEADADFRHRVPRLDTAGEERGITAGPETLRRTEEARQNPERFPIQILHPYDYGIPVYCYRPMAVQAENLLSCITLATRQDEDGDTALHIAVVKGEHDIVYELIQLLLLAHKSLDIYNNLRQTPLHLAVITQQANMVNALLNAGADPTALDRHGQTALHLCCEYNQRDCLSVLLSCSLSSACLEIRNFEGLSPLHLAVQRGHRDLAGMLLSVGADINAMDIKSGQSPLMHAVESNNADMVHFLIERGCDVNSQSYSGNTALHNACGRGQVDTVRLLLKSGADSSLKNYHNDTPVMVAKNKKISDVLRGRGSNQTRVQDHLSISNSSHGSHLTETGSPSPSHSRGCSPATTPY